MPSFLLTLTGDEVLEIIKKHLLSKNISYVGNIRYNVEYSSLKNVMMNVELIDSENKNSDINITKND